MEQIIPDTFKMEDLNEYVKKKSDQLGLYPN